MKKISVIIAAYNAEEYLSETLDSIFLQTMNDSEYEVIIINDGSSDSTLDILNSYKQTYSNLIIIDKENGGPSSARNAGLDIAKGEYNNYFQRIQMLDVKVGLLMAFYGIIYNNIIDMENIKSILVEININKNITFFNVLSLHINIISILLFIITMGTLIYNLISRDTRFVPITIFNNAVTEYNEDELTTNLIEKTYKVSIKENNDVLDKKHKMFNNSCKLLVIHIIIILINEFLKL